MRLTLAQHLADTEAAGASLFRSGTRWADAYLRFFKLPTTDAEHERFVLHLRVAGLFHDLGKANESFLAAILAPGRQQQPIRHEHLSALVMCHPAVDAWLAKRRDLDRDSVVAAVLSHHLKASDVGDWRVLEPRGPGTTRLRMRDPQVIETFSRIGELLGIDAPGDVLPREPYPHPSWTPALEGLLSRARSYANDEIRNTKKNETLRRQRTLALKAALIASDSVASATWRERLVADDWINAVAHRTALEFDAVENDILAPRRAELGSRFVKWHDFQTRAAEIGPRGLLLAACGAGKTIAAWLWAQAQSRSRPIGRVIFLYPTRGTATEGFRDYVAHAPESDARLVHGTAEYELAGMMANPPESLRGKDIGVEETEARMFALGLWNKRYFAATVDQFLGFIEHSYKGICLLPALADAAVIFDEVHSYDERMFNALVAFLRAFDVPVLCMTATLPPGRSQQLVATGLRLYPTPEESSDFHDLQDKETCKRYRLTEVADDDAACELAIGAYREGRRVLWVVNTVARCQQAARTLRARLPEASVLVYHSRFRLCDRQQRHADTIAAFRAPPAGQPPPAIAVTTQVCEMSLDLDADLLISERAPITALIQRFGRANRHLRRRHSEPAFVGQLVVYPEPSHLPYEARELEAAAGFLADLRDRDLSQRDLADGLARHSIATRDATGISSFLTGGFYAIPNALRDTDEAGSRAILDTDVSAFRELTRRRESTDGLILTIPKRHARTDEGADLPQFLKVADGNRYDPWLGFETGTEQEGAKGHERVC